MIQSQNLAIKKHLESGKSINPLQALSKFGCFRLGARIYELKNDFHMDIRKEMIRKNGKRFASYRAAL